MQGASGPARLQQVFNNFAKIIDNPSRNSQRPRAFHATAPWCAWDVNGFAQSAQKHLENTHEAVGLSEKWGVWTILDMGWRPQGVLK